MLKLNLQRQHLRLLLDILNHNTPGAEVWAYGSRVNGTAHEGSDLDLVLRDPSGLNRRQKQLWRLREALRESNLPMLVDVLDWARIPDDFRREIQRQHLCIRAAAAAEPVSANFAS
jgi:predicted nucleotidyltransferase